MLVDVIEMRCRGTRLPVEVVKGMTPVRGRLMLNNDRPGSNRPRPLMAYLMCPDSTDMALLPLDHACVTRIKDDDNMVIVGYQEGDRRSSRPYQQAWWVRVVAAGATDDSTSAGGRTVPPTVAN